MLSFLVVCFLQTDNASVFSGNITQVGSPVGSAMNLIPEDGLPPILISTGVKGGEGIIWQPAFMLTRCNNLVATVFILKIRCWQRVEYWKEFSVSTHG